MKTVRLPGKIASIGIRLNPKERKECNPIADVVISGFNGATWQSADKSSSGTLNIPSGTHGKADITISMGGCTFTATVIVEGGCA